MAKQDGGDGNNKRNGDTKIALTLRVLVAVYVLYLAYGLIQGFGETSGNDRLFIAIAIVIFIAGGGAILFFSGRKLVRKDYIDATQDIEGDAGDESAETGEEKE